MGAHKLNVLDVVGRGEMHGLDGMGGWGRDVPLCNLGHQHRACLLSFLFVIIVYFFLCLYSCVCSILTLIMKTLSNSPNSMSCLRWRKRKGQRTLYKRQIMSSASCSFSLILLLVPEFTNGVLSHSLNNLTELKILGGAKLSSTQSLGRCSRAGYR